jgi:hypothetical protein
MRRSRQLIILITFLVAFLPQSVFSESDLSESTPPELYHWKDWVMHGNEELSCPTRYNDQTAYICTWPTELDLTIEKEGGAFTQIWHVHSETMVPLPGNSTAWPSNVTVDGKQVPVVSRNGLPVLNLSKGTHTVAGEFKWLKTPQALSVPPSVGLTSLTLFGQKIVSPRIDENGRLWLSKEKTEKVKEDSYEAAVYRLINDTIPMRITTRMQIKVSGSVREIDFPGLLFSDSSPVAIQSQLPVRAGAGGDVTIQARPGNWDIRITSRFPGPIPELILENTMFEREFWSFESQNQLRMVTVEGAPSIDPSQTAMPPDWQRYPAYLVKKGQGLVFKETRRGDPDPAPDKLNLNRTFWLDFDGKGLTVQDTITGTMSENWYLAINPPAELGRASVDGQDMLITRQGPEGKPGIQLRKGILQVDADLRYTERTGKISAVGWDHDFQQVSGVLNLPPGWRLFSAAGVDSLPGTWLQKWTLMDLFLVLIISLSLFKLRNWKWGLIALFTLCLIFHEAGAPKIVWLFIVAAMALARALPEGRFRRLADIAGVIALVVLLVVSIPFMVQQIRYGVFPQLEPVGYQGYLRAPAIVFEKEAMSPDTDSLMRYQSSDDFELEERTLTAPKASSRWQKDAVNTYDPDVLVQTGPGVPNWEWRSYPLNWNGPVKSDQVIKLRLLSPTANLILSVLRVLLLAVLIFCVINTRMLWKYVKRKNLAGNMATMALLCILAVPALARAETGQHPFPPQELLQEFEKRLLEKNECYPSCADILTLEITAKPDTLHLEMNVSAAVDTAIPLPVTSASWQPDRILIDGQKITGLSREDAGTIWALIPRGVHDIIISGSTFSENDIQLPFILKPHFTYSKCNGWDVLGVNPDGSVGSSIQLTRVEKAGGDNAPKTFEPSKIPVFLEVERTFHLGISWSITTRFTVRSEAQSSIVLSYPLLSNEAVTTPGIDVKNGKATITVAPGSAFTMASVLDISPEINLTAPENVPWTETWVLDVSPIWSCDLSGIPVIHHQDDQGQWKPTWKPWPGEIVRIGIARPEAIPGSSVTIDSADLRFTPGQRYDNASLNLSLRTSRGGQHEIELPENALLQGLEIDGRSLPVKQDGRRLSFPLQPGANSVSVEWQQASSSRVLISSPEVKIGGQAVNASVSFNMPTNRWGLLTGGPRLGPAVLFWSYLVVVVLAAFGLKYIKFTPLKFWHWLLLGIGLTQVMPIQAVAVVAWFIAFGWREKHYPKERWFSFNLVQIGLFFLTLVFLGCLYVAIERGLLGIPDMQIAGNGSSNWVFNWTQDRIDGYMPNAWAVTVPLWVYHVLMLFWSLWLAFSLIKWLPWGWKCYGSGGGWKKRKPNEKEKEKQL